MKRFRSLSRIVVIVCVVLAGISVAVTASNALNHPEAPIFPDDTAHIQYQEESVRVTYTEQASAEFIEIRVRELKNNGNHEQAAIRTTQLRTEGENVIVDGPAIESGDIYQVVVVAVLPSRNWTIATTRNRV